MPLSLAKWLTSSSTKIVPVSPGQSSNPHAKSQTSKQACVEQFMSAATVPGLRVVEHRSGGNDERTIAKHVASARARATARVLRHSLPLERLLWQAPSVKRRLGKNLAVRHHVVSSATRARSLHAVPAAQGGAGAGPALERARLAARRPRRRPLARRGSSAGAYLAQHTRRTHHSHLSTSAHPSCLLACSLLL